MDLSGKKIGQIRVDERIGSGGMGDVYRGFDEKLKRTVAIKVLRPDARFNPNLRARFLREARILSQLEHPSICRVYDLVEEDDTDLLILEYIDGHTLTPKRLAALPYEQKLRVAITLAEVLVVAHRAGIVHRDLKPENLMMTRKGVLKVLDFGIARRFREQLAESGIYNPSQIFQFSHPDLEEKLETTRIDRPVNAPSNVDLDRTFHTDHVAMVGTLTYMSPEQSLQQEVTAASDMYSYGIILQELFTGKRAYPENLRFPDLIISVSEGRTVAPEGLEPDLTELIVQLKDKVASQRPTASTTRDRLLWIRDRPARRRRRIRRNLALSGALVLLLLITAVVVRSRFLAQELASAAQSFAQQARDVEWTLRTAALSPPRDVRPLRHEIRRRMSVLQEEMAALGDLARGPGEYALGRAALALGDFDIAREHLEAALEAEPERADARVALGVTLMEIYERELADLRRRLPPEEREETLAELRREWVEPAQEHLRSRPDESAEASGLLRLESSGYGKALVALADENFEVALVYAKGTLEDSPQLYETHALIGRILLDRGEARAQSGDYDRAGEDFRAAHEAFLRAAEIGRGDPAVFLGICSLTEAWVRLRVHGTGGEIEPILADGIPLCEKALAIDPDHAEALGLLAALHFRRAEFDLKSSASEVERVAELARRALAIDPSLFWVWNTLGHISMVQADWEVFHDGDPQPYFARAEEAYQEALALAPGSENVWNNLGNVHSISAEWMDIRDIDPTKEAEASFDAYRHALELATGETFADLNASGTAVYWASYRLRHAIDPRSIVEEGKEFAASCLGRNPNEASCLMNRADLLALEARWLLRQGTIEEAAELLGDARKTIDQSLEIRSDKFYALLTSARVHLAQGELAQARGENARAHWRRMEEILDEADRLDPGHVHLAPLRAELDRHR